MVRSFEKEIYPPGYKNAGLGFCGESLTYRDLRELGLDVSRGSSNSGAYPRFNCYWLTVEMGHAEFKVTVYEKTPFYDRVHKVLTDESLPDEKKVDKISKMVIKETMKTTDIMEMLEAVYEDGIETGKKLKQEELKTVLGIKDSYY